MEENNSSLNILSPDFACAIIGLKGKKQSGLDLQHAMVD